MQNSFIPRVSQLLLLNLAILTFYHIRKICFAGAFPHPLWQLRGTEGCWHSKGGSSEHLHPSELCSPTVDSWNQTQHLPSLYILQEPQRICLLSLNPSLSIQKPKKPPTKLPQLCLLKALIKRDINHNHDCREGHFSLTLRASSKRVFCIITGKKLQE